MCLKIHTLRAWLIRFERFFYCFQLNENPAYTCKKNDICTVNCGPKDCGFLKYHSFLCSGNLPCSPYISNAGTSISREIYLCWNSGFIIKAINNGVFICRTPPQDWLLSTRETGKEKRLLRLVLHWEPPGMESKSSLFNLWKDKKISAKLMRWRNAIFQSRQKDLGVRDLSNQEHVNHWTYTLQTGGWIIFEMFYFTPTVVWLF